MALRRMPWHRRGAPRFLVGFAGWALSGEAMRDGRLQGRALWVVLAALAALPAAGCVSLSLLPGAPGALEETVVHGDRGPKILLIRVDGVIRESSPQPRSAFSRRDESSVARLREELDRARDDPEVRALLLRINSPGGSATASDIMYSEILRFKAERDIPVVAQLMGVATSGGYYIAMAADRVIAHPTTVTGSIGVIFLSVNLVGLMKKLGIEDQTLVAGAQKDAASPLRRMTPAERERIQAVLDGLHRRFKGVVAEGRQLEAGRVDSVADGGIFGADEALALGLVDQIGELEDAVAAAEQAAGIATSRVVSYHRPREWRQNLYTGPLVPTTVRLELAMPLPRLDGPAFLYLWAPGAP
ncbi:MAG: signal peptide peptidase SppA [Myxococcota bacterium]